MTPLGEAGCALLSFGAWMAFFLGLRRFLLKRFPPPISCLVCRDTGRWLAGNSVWPCPRCRR